MASREQTPAKAPAETMSLARRISWWALLAMVVLVPIVMTDFTLPGLNTRLAFGSVDMAKLSVERVLALVALGAWAWDILRRGGRIRHTPVDWLILAWLVWVAVTTATSIHWPTALFGTEGRYEGLLTYITYALIYFLSLQFVDSPLRVRRLAQALFWASVIVSCYGLLQFIDVVFLPKDMPWEENRAFSTYGNPNMFGSFLVFTVTVALGLALHERKLAWRLVYWVGFGLNGLALIVSFTRGAWMGAVVSLVLLVVMAWRQRVPMRRVDWGPIGVFAAAAIAVIVRSLSSTNEVMNFAKRLGTIFQFSAGSGQTRTEIWRAALAAIKERPLFGWGADNFGFAFSKLKPVEYVRDAGGSSGADNAHDYPLHLATGVGILGAFLFYGICVWAGVRSFRTVFGRSSDSTRIILGAFWAASAGYLVSLFVGISVVGVTFLLWIALALVLVPTARSKEVGARKLGTVAATVVLLIAVLGIAGQGVVLAADTYYVAGKDEFSQSTIPERTADATRAVKLNPYDSVYRSGLAGVHLDELNASVRALAKARRTGEDTARYTEKVRESFADAESAFRDAIAFAPADYANYVNLASVYLVAAPELGDELYQRAIDIAKQGLEVMPYGIDIRLRLAEALRNTGRETEATETLAYCVQIDPRAGTAALMLADIYREQGRAAEALALLKSVEALAPGQAGVAAVIRELEAGGAAQ